jgi:hypothetical protein
MKIHNVMWPDPLKISAIPEVGANTSPLEWSSGAMAVLEPFGNTIYTQQPMECPVSPYGYRESGWKDPLKLQRIYGGAFECGNSNCQDDGGNAVKPHKIPKNKAAGGHFFPGKDLPAGAPQGQWGSMEEWNVLRSKNLDLRARRPHKFEGTDSYTGYQVGAYGHKTYCAHIDPANFEAILEAYDEDKWGHEVGHDIDTVIPFKDRVELLGIPAKFRTLMDDVESCDGAELAAKTAAWEAAGDGYWYDDVNGDGSSISCRRLPAGNALLVRDAFYMNHGHKVDRDGNAVASDHANYYNRSQYWSNTGTVCPGRKCKTVIPVKALYWRKYEDQSPVMSKANDGYKNDRGHFKPHHRVWPMGSAFIQTNKWWMPGRRGWATSDFIPSMTPFNYEGSYERDTLRRGFRKTMVYQKTLPANTGDEYYTFNDRAYYLFEKAGSPATNPMNDGYAENAGIEFLPEFNSNVNSAAWFTGEGPKTPKGAGTLPADFVGRVRMNEGLYSTGHPKREENEPMGWAPKKMQPCESWPEGGLGQYCNGEWGDYAMTPQRQAILDTNQKLALVNDITGIGNTDMGSCDFTKHGDPLKRVIAEDTNILFLSPWMPEHIQNTVAKYNNFMDLTRGYEVDATEWTKSTAIESATVPKGHYLIDNSMSYFLFGNPNYGKSSARGRGRQCCRYSSGCRGRGGPGALGYEANGFCGS